MAKRRFGWLLWCVAMGLLYLFENNTATRILLISSVVLPFMGWLFFLLVVKHVVVRLDAPQDAQKRADFRVVCTIHGPVQLVKIDVELHCRNLLTGEAIQATSPRQGKVLSCSLRTAHCGLLMLEATVSIQDVFGLFVTKLPQAQSVSVWVVPQLRALEIVLAESGGDWQDDAASNPEPGIDASDPFSVREYIPGDPVRQIHWKLSQKTDTIMLRELKRPVAYQVLLIFDASYAMDAGESFPAAADTMAEVFLSMSKSLLGRGIPHTVCWHPSKQSIPTYQPMSADEDLAELMSAFFSDGPVRDAPILPDEHTECFAHVALIATGCPDNNAIRGFGQQLTVISEGSCLDHNRVIF